MLRLRRVGRRLALVSLDDAWTPDESVLEGIVVRQVKSQK
jgi:hypothetical protein